MTIALFLFFVASVVLGPEIGIGLAIIGGACYGLWLFAGWVRWQVGFYRRRRAERRSRMALP